MFRQTHTGDRHGSQGVMDTASHGTLEAEFGTHKEEDVVQQILEKGDCQNHEVRSCSSFESIDLLCHRREGDLASAISRRVALLVTEC